VEHRDAEQRGLYPHRFRPDRGAIPGKLREFGAKSLRALGRHSMNRNNLLPKK
jgi:hypothetical protein